jgi:nitroreductase
MNLIFSYLLHKVQLGTKEEAFFNIMFRRHSIRAYKDRPIERWKLRQILDTVNSAPSAGNLQAYEVFTIFNKEKKLQLAEAAHGQEFIAEAPVVFVFAANPSRSAARYGKRGKELYSVQDATIAASYAQLSATALELGSVWIGSFDEKSVLKVLDQEIEVRPVVIMPIGYGAEDPELTSRRTLEDLVHVM